MDDVYVVEAAFTGPKGFPMDKVVEVSVCRMHRDGTDYDTIYDSFVGCDPMDLGKDALDFLNDNYGITAETLYAAPDEDVVVKELLAKLRDTECTSFDVNRTFGQFLCVEPWDLNGELTLLPSLSSRIPPEYRHSLKEAYDYVTPGNPMDVSGSTSMDLCLMSTSIMMRLRTTGFFRSCPDGEMEIEYRIRQRYQEKYDVQEQEAHCREVLEYRHYDVRRQAEKQKVAQPEEHESEQQHEVTERPVIVAVDLPDAQEAEQRRYDDHYEPEGVRIGMLGLRLLLPVLLGRFGRHLGVALRTGYAVRRDRFSAFGAIACHSIFLSMKAVQLADAISFPSSE